MFESGGKNAGEVRRGSIGTRLRLASIAFCVVAAAGCSDTDSEVRQARECFEATLAVRNTQSEMQSYSGEGGVKAFQQALNWAEKACRRPHDKL